MKHRLSIRKQLLALFVPGLFGLWIVSAVISFWLVSSFSSEWFDRDLINSADSVVGRLRVKDHKVVVDLPPAAQAILKHDESDRLYYRVLGADGSSISGDADLPPPSSDLKVDAPKIVSDRILDKEVRIAEVKATVDGEGAPTVIVQVAETTNLRSQFQQKMLLTIAAPQLIVIIFGLSSVWYGIAKILTPLRSLQRQLADRKKFDLSALEDTDTPEEVFPLVSALNELLGRLREEIQAHQRFISNAAHQLRTPLAGLKTYSSIGVEMSNTKDLKHIIKQLDEGIDRASRMVTQLLALARTDAAEAFEAKLRTSIDLNFVVSDVVEALVKESIRKDVSLEFQPSPSPIVVVGDQSGLRHLVANLIENALLYTPSGGSVTVQVRNDGAPILSVSDTGPGIPPSERTKVLERFYRIEGTSGAGSGLGLAIVKEVVSSHGAELAIESGPGGEGTTVVVRF